MTMVTEYDWESDTWTHHTAENAARQAWREAAAEIADKARAKLPECNGRVERAVKLVLAGDVELLADGTARVASQSNGTTTYHIVNGHCDCLDYEKAPHQFCTHRLSAAIARRAQALTRTKRADTNGQATDQAAAPAPATPLPEAPASVNVHLDLAGRQVQLTLRDSDEGRLLARLDAMRQRFPAAAKAADTIPQCPTHGAMKPSTKGKGWYCPHKLADGSWCKGK